MILILQAWGWRGSRLASLEMCSESQVIFNFHGVDWLWLPNYFHVRCDDRLVDHHNCTPNEVLSHPHLLVAGY